VISSFICWNDVDGHTHYLLTAAEDDALDRTDIVEVSTPRQLDVMVGWDEIIRRVDVNPPYLRAVDR
jgi:hypothetical protein